ncbi:zf-CSL-domain-containing protein [Ascobolus immersus RN42]|uniref:Diphthamide biosynthesis protein 3 n=1 Tax=Ascobolus immersus RN42 TaxID=1160509 RepID=A0A3N4IKS7_ASCIM|nr:zf-CSL-domain-containing protein [Ascobolus immersus RN42]
MAEEEEGFYDQVEIEDMTFDAALQSYWYPCPCGDKFWVCIDDLREGQDVAVCPSCSLIIQVIYEPEDLPAPVTPAAGVTVSA